MPGGDLPYRDANHTEAASRGTGAGPLAAAPWPPRRTASSAANVWTGKALDNENVANVPAVDRHGSAEPAEVAILGALLPWPARAGHTLETGAAARDELAQALSGLFRAAALIVAARIVATLWRIKASQAVYTTSCRRIVSPSMTSIGPDWRGSGRKVTTSVFRTTGLLWQSRKTSSRQRRTRRQRRPRGNRHA